MVAVYLSRQYNQCFFVAQNEGFELFIMKSDLLFLYEIHGSTKIAAQKLILCPPT